MVRLVLAAFAVSAFPALADDGTLRERLEAGTCDGCDLVDLDLSGIDLSGKTLRLGNVARVNWTGANLSDATITAAALDGDFTDAKLDNLSLSGKLSGKLARTTATGARIRGGLNAKIDHSDLSGATILHISRQSGEFIRDSKLTAARLGFDFCYNAPIDRTDMRGAQIESRGTFRFCNITDSDLSYARIDGWFYSESFNRTLLEGAQIKLRMSQGSFPIPSELAVNGGSLQSARIDGETRDLRISPSTGTDGLLINGQLFGVSP